jgi:hypothetical protein
MAGPAAGNERPIESIRELRRLVPSLIQRINADQGLALRAAANPLIAIEELGVRLAPSVRTEAERRVRFSKAARERLLVLEKEVFKHAGYVFELDDPQALERVLYKELKLPRSTAQAQAQAEAVAPNAPKARAPSVAFAREFVDPYDVLAGSHPIMAPLLEYRRLEASQPKLAPRDLYERIRRGEVRAPVVRLRARLKNEPADEG